MFKCKCEFKELDYKKEIYHKDAVITGLNQRIGAFEQHLEFLTNHIERHSNCRKEAELQRDKMAEVFFKFIESNCADKELIKTVLEFKTKK